MPRRNRPRGARGGSDDEAPRIPDLVVGAPTGWQARTSSKPGPYTCPGCNRTLRDIGLHVVAWRSDGVGDRRHWHKACFERWARAR